MILIWILFLLTTLIYSFKKSIYGCCCLLVSRILIPECVRLTPLLDISLNTAVICIIIISMLKDIPKIQNIRRVNNSYTKYLIVFICYYIISLPFSSYTNYGYQFSRLIQFIITDIVPVFIFMISIKKRENLQILINTLLICSIILCVWGILTTLLGENPYVDFLKNIYNQNETLITETTNNGRGYTSSSATFLHENGLGYFLPITFSFFFYLKIIDKKKIYTYLLFLLTILIIICAKRSAFIAYFSFWIFYFAQMNIRKRFQLLKYGILLFIIIYIIVSIFPQLNNIKGMIESSLFFWNDSIAEDNEIGGSNFEMRVFQILYSFIEIKDNLLFGHGFGWSNYYLTQNPFHPILYGFETIISEATVNGGIIGLILWIIMFYKSYKYSIQKASSTKDIIYCKIFTIVQIVIAVATGFSYFIFYGIYIVILNKIHELNFIKHENINRNSNI